MSLIVLLGSCLLPKDMKGDSLDQTRGAQLPLLAHQQMLTVLCYTTSPEAGLIPSGKMCNLSFSLFVMMALLTCWVIKLFFFWCVKESV